MAGFKVSSHHCRNDVGDQRGPILSWGRRPGSACPRAARACRTSGDQCRSGSRTNLRLGCGLFGARTLLGRANLRPVFAAIVSALLTGFLIGAAARLALPGPDPMPFFLTALIGLAGAVAGGGIATGIFGTGHDFDSSGHAFATLLLEVGVAIGLVAAYRRVVQKRPLWGPEAHRFPTRGLGVARMRAQLRRLGVDPDRRSGRAGAPPTPKELTELAEELERLRDLRDRVGSDLGVSTKTLRIWTRQAAIDAGERLKQAITEAR
jgi:uncharacterized membrane protein YeaQ/YmgE (transglycosylase-associated protein family)